MRRLLDAGVDFVIVGGWAAIAHGARRSTLDLDIVAAFNRENMARLLAALADTHPRNSARPDLGELVASPEELARYRNLYLTTDFGELDVLGELPPVGGYSEAAASAVEVEMFGRTCPILAIEHIIAIKEFLGRPKDHEALRELRELRDKGAGA